MPDTDGFELISIYKKTPETCGIPVLILSSEDDPEQKAKAFNLGASDYLLKSSDKIEFIARIKYHAARKISEMHDTQTYIYDGELIRHACKLLLIDPFGKFSKIFENR